MDNIPDAVYGAAPTPDIRLVNRLKIRESLTQIEEALNDMWRMPGSDEDNLVKAQNAVSRIRRCIDGH